MAEKTTYVIALNDKLSPGLKKATAKALGLDKAMGGIGDKTSKGSRGIGSMAGSLKGLIGPLALAAAGMKAFQFASESVATAREFESLTNAINFASGSAEEGAKNMEFLRSRADLLGTDLLSSTEGFKTLSAAMLGSKLEGQATRDIFDGVQVAATAMGLSSENAKGTFLALGQIMGKGKVQAEELRGQIGERIPGAFNIAARAMGVSTQELNKMMEQGKLLAEDFLPKFSNELKKTFGEALPTAAQSSQAQFNRFNNSMLELKISIGNKLMPVINRLMSGFKSLMSFLSTNKAVIMDALSPLMDVGREIIGVYKGLADQLGITTGASQIFAKGLAILKKVLQFLKPMWMSMVKALGAGWSVMIKIGKAMGGFIERFPVIGKTFFALVSVLREGFMIIQETAVNVLGGVGDLLAGIFSGNVSQIEKGLVGISRVTDLVGKESGERMASALKSGFNSEMGLKEVVVKGSAKESKGFDDVLKQTKLGQGSGLASGSGGGSGAGAAGNKASSSISGVKSGRPTNVNISIGKLIETFNVSTTNMQDTTNQLKDKIAETLLTAVNNVNNIAQ